MRVLLLGVILVSLFASKRANADVEGALAAEAVRFAQLVKTGDQARVAGRNQDALKAYNDALGIRDDAAVAGRLGLVMLALNDHRAAAEYLLHAITKAQAPPYLMKQFHDAFARVRPKVCFVEVFVSERDATVTIDGEQEQASDHNAFHVFVTAGSHRFHAKLEGFEDATETIDAAGGGDRQVRLELKPLPSQPAVQEEPTPNSITKPAVVDKPTHRLSESYTNFYVGAGGILMLGATPGVAVGPQITGGFRRGFVSVNLDARFAAALTTLETAPESRFVAWSVGVRPCAHYAFMFGCGVVQVDGMRSLSANFQPQTRFGGGLRGGIEFVLRKPVLLQLWGEGIMHLSPYSVVRNSRGLWQSSRLLGGFGATAFLTW